MASSDLFRRLIEPGRICVIQYGPDYDKVAVIVDIIDQNRALIDGPTTGVARQSIPMKRLHLSDFVVKHVQRGCRTKALTKFLEADQTMKQFEESPGGRKRAAQAFNKSMTDFERFRVMVAHKRRRSIIQKTLSVK